MPNGKSGDHPITDIMIHGRSVYGDPLDSELRALGALMSYQRLCDWFHEQEHWTTPKEELRPIVAQKLAELQAEAQDRGWEISP